MKGARHVAAGEVRVTAVSPVQVESYGSPPTMQPRRGSRRSEPQDRASVFSPHLVLFRLDRSDGRSGTLALQGTAEVFGRWREALVSQANDMPGPVREIVSGHAADGRPLERPHLAFLPLPDVGRPHADGRLLGIAAALPVGLAPELRAGIFQVLQRVKELKLGRMGVWRLSPEPVTGLSRSLSPTTWTAYPEGARHWSTVTPVAFDRHPKSRGQPAHQREVAEMIGVACQAVGLPRPREVIVTPVSAHLGVPPAFEFPRLKRKDGSERRHAHAILVFDRPVVGPVLIGAGRYRGYGVCRPMEQG